MRLKILKYTIFVLIAILPLFISQVPVTITAKTGIINKEIDSSKTKFSFDIECEVNKNISNNMTNIDISIGVKKSIDDTNEANAICHLVPVRLINVLTRSTKLFCIINLESPLSFGIEDNLIITSSPTQQPQSEGTAAATFTFEDFEKISTVININNDLELKYLDDGYCKNNHFLFKMVSTSDLSDKPLLSTICNVSLDGDAYHKIARCAIPLTGNTIVCNVDVSKKKYNENDKISIIAQNSIPCENGQMMSIDNDVTNILTIKEECGEIINNNNECLCNNFLVFLILFFALI